MVIGRFRRTRRTNTNTADALQSLQRGRVQRRMPVGLDCFRDQPKRSVEQRGGRRGPPPPLFALCFTRAAVNPERYKGQGLVLWDCTGSARFAIVGKDTYGLQRIDRNGTSVTWWSLWRLRPVKVDRLTCAVDTMATTRPRDVGGVLRSTAMVFGTAIRKSAQKLIHRSERSTGRLRFEMARTRRIPRRWGALCFRRLISFCSRHSTHRRLHLLDSARSHSLFSRSRASIRIAFALTRSCLSKSARSSCEEAHQRDCAACQRGDCAHLSYFDRRRVYSRGGQPGVPLHWIADSGYQCQASS